MSEKKLRERLHRVTEQVRNIKKMPLLQRASAAEQCLESTLFLVEGIIDELEVLGAGK